MCLFYSNPPSPEGISHRIPREGCGLGASVQYHGPRNPLASVGGLACTRWDSSFARQTSLAHTKHQQLFCKRFPRQRREKSREGVHASPSISLSLASPRCTPTLLYVLVRMHHTPRFDKRRERTGCGLARCRRTSWRRRLRHPLPRNPKGFCRRGGRASPCPARRSSRA